MPYQFLFFIPSIYFNIETNMPIFYKPILDSDVTTLNIKGDVEWWNF